MTRNDNASKTDRARAYMDKMDAAVSNQFGHKAFFHVAAVLVQDFAFSADEARPLLREFNARCAPPFSEQEIERKLRDAVIRIDPVRLGRLAGPDAARVWPDALHQWAALRGMSVAALKTLGAFADRQEVHTPERDGSGETTAINRRRGDNQPFPCGDKSLVRKGGKRGLFMPWPLTGEGPVLVTEGMPDAARALTAGWNDVVGLPNAKPGRVVLRMLAKLLAGRDVVVIPDPGESGRQSLAQVGKFLVNAGCRVRYVPAGDQDLDDRLRTEIDQAAALARLVNEEAIPWRPPDEAGGAAPPETGEGGEDGRAVVRIGPDEARVNGEILDALKTREKNLYRRSGKLVTAVNATSDEARKISRFGGLSIAVVNTSWVRNVVTRHCRLMDYDELKRRWVWAHPPQWVGNALISLREWPGINELFGVASYPVLAAEGIITEPCFDPDSGWLVQPLVRPVGFVAQPGADDLARARAALHEVVEDFPFAHDAGEAAWLAYVLTILARPSIEGPAPLFMADASVRGSGKTMLISAGGMIAMGVSPSVCPETDDGDEQRKRILSLLMAGDMVVLFDNVTKLGGSALDSLLTNYPTWTDRILGASEAPKVPNLTVWSATSNNPQILGDARRRILPIRLEPNEERPEERTGFRHANLLSWVADRQPELLGAALTLLAGWHAAGRPDQGLTPWGSYEAWSGVVRNALVWAGYPDPAECRQELVVIADPDVAQLAALLDLLARHGKPIKAAEIVAKIANQEWQGEDADAVKECAQAGNGGLSARILGKRLERWRGRVAGERRLEARPGRGGFMLYRAEEAIDSGKHSHPQSPFGFNGDCVTSGDFVSAKPSRDAGADVGARTYTRGLSLEHSHPQSHSHHANAQALRDRLAARGVALKLEAGRLVVVGSLTEAEDAEVALLHGDLKALLGREQDGMPF